MDAIQNARQQKRDKATREFNLLLQDRDRAFQRERDKQDIDNGAISASGGAFVNILMERKNKFGDLTARILANPEFLALPAAGELLTKIDEYDRELSRGIVDLTHSAAAAVSGGRDPVEFAKEYGAKMRTYLGTDGSDSIPLVNENGKFDGEAVAAKMGALGAVNVFMRYSQLNAAHQGMQAKSKEVALEAAQRHAESLIAMRRVTGAMGGFDPDNEATIQGAVERTSLRLSEALADPRSGFEGSDPIQFLARTLEKSGDAAGLTAAGVLRDLHDEYFTGGTRDAKAYVQSGGDTMRVVPAMQYLTSFVLPTLESIRNKDANAATFYSVDSEGNFVEHRIAPGDDLRRARLTLNQSDIGAERLDKMITGITLATSILQTTKSFDDFLTTRESAKILGEYGRAADEFKQTTGRDAGPVENAAIWQRVLSSEPELATMMDVMASQYQGLSAFAPTDINFATREAESEIVGPASTEAIGGAGSGQALGNPSPQPVPAPLGGPQNGVQPRGAPGHQRPQLTVTNRFLGGP